MAARQKIARLPLGARQGRRGGAGADFGAHLRAQDGESVSRLPVDLRRGQKIDDARPQPAQAGQGHGGEIARHGQQPSRRPFIHGQRGRGQPGLIGVYERRRVPAVFLLQEGKAEELAQGARAPDKLRPCQRIIRPPAAHGVQADAVDGDFQFELGLGRARGDRRQGHGRGKGEDKGQNDLAHVNLLVNRLHRHGSMTCHA